MFEWPTKCSEVRWEMGDDHYEESTADARPGDLVWDYKGGDDPAHVLVEPTDTTDYGFIPPFPRQRCECDKVDISDHHVVILARKEV